MNRFGKFILTATAVCFSLLLQAQSFEQIIDNHILAMGGIEKITAVNDAVMTGTFTTAGSTPVQIVTAKKNEVGSRIDIDVNGTNNFQLINRENGWIYTPVQGDQAPRFLPADLVKVSQVQLDLHGPFINYKEKGIKINLAGIDSLAASVYYKLNVVFPNGVEMVYYIDSKSYYIAKTSTRLVQFGALEEVVTYYNDYRKNADGYWFAYRNISPRGETKYEKIETNTTIDDKRFELTGN